MTQQVTDALDVEPGIYTSKDKEFETINKLTYHEYTQYLDTLAHLSRTCQYNESDDTFTVT